ncbi:hypothetical protein ACHAXT_006066 [Thalassiosira profunda]
MDNFADDSDEDVSVRAGGDGPGAELDAAVVRVTEYAKKSGIDFDVIPPSRWDASGDHPPFYGGMMLQIQYKLLQLTADVLNVLMNPEECPFCPIHIDIDSRFDIDGNQADYDDDYNGGEPYLAEHDELLIPLWRAFTDALRDAPAGYMGSISVCGIQLPGKVCDMLSSALHNKHITRMELARVDLGTEGLAFLAAHIEGNPRLRVLKLFNDPIEDMDLAARLLSAVKNHRALRELYLTYCGVARAANEEEILRTIMDGCENLTALDLQGNEIGLEGARCIASALEKNPPLETLYINANNIGDDAMGAVARTLASNNNLKALYVNDNTGFTKIGRDALQRAVYNTSNLNAIKDSNHNCYIDIPWKQDPTGLPLGLCNYLVQGHGAKLDADQWRRVRTPYSLQVRIKSKLLFALGAYFDQGPFNFQYLSDVPLELMPRVLSFLQMTDVVPEVERDLVLGDQGDVLSNFIVRETPLRNVFEAVKHCLVPLLLVPQTTERERRRARRGRKRARVEVGGSREETTRNSEGSTLTHEPSLFPNRIPIDGKLSEQQCHAAGELLDEFLNKCRLGQDESCVPLINGPRKYGCQLYVRSVQQNRINSLAGLLRERLRKRNDSNGVVELLSCSGDVYEGENGALLMRKDIKKLCFLLNLSPCQLGTSALSCTRM